MRTRLWTTVNDCAPLMLALGAASTQAVYIPPVVGVGAGLP